MAVSNVAGNPSGAASQTPGGQQAGKPDASQMAAFKAHHDQVAQEVSALGGQVLSGKGSTAKMEAELPALEAKQQAQNKNGANSTNPLQANATNPLQAGAVAQATPQLASTSPGAVLSVPA